MLRQSTQTKFHYDSELLNYSITLSHDETTYLSEVHAYAEWMSSSQHTQSNHSDLLLEWMDTCSTRSYGYQEFLTLAQVAAARGFKTAVNLPISEEEYTYRHTIKRFETWLKSQNRQERTDQQHLLFWMKTDFRHGDIDDYHQFMVLSSILSNRGFQTAVDVPLSEAEFTDAMHSHSAAMTRSAFTIGMMALLSQPASDYSVAMDLHQASVKSTREMCERIASEYRPLTTPHRSMLYNAVAQELGMTESHTTNPTHAEADLALPELRNFNRNYSSALSRYGLFSDRHRQNSLTYEYEMDENIQPATKRLPSFNI